MVSSNYVVSLGERRWHGAVVIAGARKLAMERKSGSERREDTEGIAS